MLDIGDAASGRLCWCQRALRTDHHLGCTCHSDRRIGEMKRSSLFFSPFFFYFIFCVAIVKVATYNSDLRIDYWLSPCYEIKSLLLCFLAQANIYTQIHINTYKHIYGWYKCYFIHSFKRFALLCMLTCNFYLSLLKTDARDAIWKWNCEKLAFMWLNAVLLLLSGFWAFCWQWKHCAL